MLHRQRLDAGWIDIVAAADDHVLLTPRDAKIASLVDPAEVAGHEPTMLVERVFGRRLIVIITKHEASAAAANFPDFADRHFGVRIVLAPDANFEAPARPPASLG